MCLALSVPWVLYHSFCRALNKQVPLLELQLYKLKIYALTVCILSVRSRLRLPACVFWHTAECVFVQGTSCPARPSSSQLELFLRICIRVESNAQVVYLSVTSFNLGGRVNLPAKSMESVAGKHPFQKQGLFL